MEHRLALTTPSPSSSPSFSAQSCLTLPTNPARIVSSTQRFILVIGGTTGAQFGQVPCCQPRRTPASLSLPPQGLGPVQESHRSSDVLSAAGALLLTPHGDEVSQPAARPIWLLSLQSQALVAGTRASGDGNRQPCPSLPRPLPCRPAAAPAPAGEQTAQERAQWPLLAPPRFGESSSISILLDESSLLKV